MSKYESSIKIIDAPQLAIYERLSNFSDLQEKFESLPEEKKQEINQKMAEASKGMFSIDSVQFDKESVTIQVMGMSVSFGIVEKQPFKLLKYATVNSPIDVKLWIQMLPKDFNTSKIRVTFEADIPFFLKPMVGNKIEGIAEKIAEGLTRIQY